MKIWYVNFHFNQCVYMKILIDQLHGGIHKIILDRYSIIINKKNSLYERYSRATE